jgi:hypothetical protein
MKHCKTKCKKNCKGICKSAYNDTAEQDENHKALKEELKLVTAELQRLKAIESQYYGGRKRRTRKRKRGGFFFMGNTSNLADCETGCTDECSNNCTILCNNAISRISKHNDKNANLKDLIETKKDLIRALSYKMGIDSHLKR